MEEAIDLKEYFSTLKGYFKITKKRASYIAIITLVSMGVSAILSFFVLKPVYESSTTIIINKSSESEELTYDDYSLNEKLAGTYEEIIKSRTVLQEVIKDLNLNATYEDLLKNISIEVIKGTQILEITVQNTDKVLARNIANAIPGKFLSEGKNITGLKSVKVIDKAIIAKKPSSPNKAINIIIAGVIGLILGIVAIYILENYDKDKGLKKVDA